jgi:collagen type V/XI/XXIV/XXVII alpha
MSLTHPYIIIIIIVLQSGVGEGKTIFDIRTKKSNQLPVIDFLPLDYGAEGQAFGFEVGPVCFR